LKEQEKLEIHRRLGSDEEERMEEEEKRREAGSVLTQDNSAV
jgi:hypothetical protein